MVRNTNTVLCKCVIKDFFIALTVFYQNRYKFKIHIVKLQVRSWLVPEAQNLRLHVEGCDKIDT